MTKTINTITGYISTEKAIKSGIHQRDLKRMRDEQKLLRIKKGLYRSVDQGNVANQSFADVAVAVPKGVICLLSALSYYKLTTFNPSVVSVAIPYGSRAQKIYYPPTEFYRFSSGLYKTGIETITINKIKVKIYCREKTICDCFRYRNKLGLDTAKEALKEYLKLKDRSLKKLNDYAAICRVKPIIQNWLDALV